MKFKAGFVTIFGKPNAGKSSLFNKLLNDRLSIVTPLPQTTRNKIKGILNHDEYQIVFSDTPGFFKPHCKLHDKMMNEVNFSLTDYDVAIYIINALEKDFTEDINFLLKVKKSKPLILILNKCDLLRQNDIATKIEYLKSQTQISEIIPFSVLKNFQTDIILPQIIELLPESEPFYDKEQLTDLPTKFFVAELVREKIFLNLKKEIPYQTATLVEEFKEKEFLTYISVLIIVNSDSHKMVLLGKDGKMIRKISTESRLSLEEWLQRKVYLNFHVKVRKNWIGNETLLKEYGY